ncbi:MAG TPA: surface-adhesin E family protein [Rhodocyclaceae bacterium]
MRIQHAAMYAAIAAAFVSTGLAAADWQKVAAGRGEKVELDPTRIARAADGRMQAWTRLVLNKEVVDGETRAAYNTVEVLNSYDCDNSRFQTVKRLYLNGETLVRSEPVLTPRDVAVSPGAMDAQVLSKVCRSTAVADARSAAKVADASAPGVKRAEMVTEGKTDKAKIVTVADAHGKVSEKPAEKAAEKPAEKAPEKAAEKTAEPTMPKRMIELPKIDKSQLERPSDAKAAESKAAESKPAAAATRAMEKEAPPLIDKRTRELALATSGPRKAVKKKPAHEVSAEAHHDIHWSYEGEGGPENWSKIDAKNGVCATGKRQSPIDIGEGVKVDLEGIQFDYKPTQVRIEDNGHTIQVTPAEGNLIKIMGRTFELKQFHFHRPSEEKIRGRRFDMVVHLVHKDDDGNLAVIAVLLEKGPLEQPMIQALWNNLPLEAGMSVSPSVVIDLMKLLPVDRAYYTYMGSLTTPPCSENVLWMVFKQPVMVTPDQVSVFSRLYKNNARPVQPSNGRLIKESR